jgi:hypothetical protein
LHSDDYLEEIAAVFKGGSASSVYRVLKRFKISRKKSRFSIRNGRQEFLQSLEDVPSDKLVWVDECGVEEKTDRFYAGSQKGQRVYGEASRKRIHGRVSVIAAYVQKKLKAPFRFKGYTNSRVFEAWVEPCLIPVLVAGQIVILDNASFHKALSIRRKIEATGAFVPLFS